MTSKRASLAWRVAWPLGIMFLGSGVVAYVFHRWSSTIPEESFLGLTLGLTCSVVICAGYIGTSLVVARRYRHLVGRPVSRTIKVCVFLLFALGVVALCAGLIGLAVSISGYLLWE